MQHRAYRYRLTGLETGVHAFRLRQVDIDGTAQLLEVVSISIH
jgi:hypothetical protein